MKASPYTVVSCTRFALLRLLLGAMLGLGLQSAHADSGTRTSAFEYQASTGLLTKEIIEPDGSNLCLVTVYTYDDFGNKNKATTRNCDGSSGEAAAPTGDAVIATRSATTTYDGRGRFPTSSSNALSQSETRTYEDKWGVPLTLTGPNGLTTSWQYDSLGRKKLEIRADGTRTDWDYRHCDGLNGGTEPCPTIGGAAGAWRVQITPQNASGAQIGASTTIYYDKLNREIRSATQGFDPDGASVLIYKDTRYDELGRVSQVSRPYYIGQTVYWTTVEYDRLGRPIKQIAADTTETSTSYDGLTTTVTNAKSQTQTTVKNSQGQVLSVTDALGRTLSYAYDPYGNLTQTTDSAGNQVTLTYDRRGRKIRMDDPDMGQWNYDYNALGEMIRQTDAKSQVSTLVYDKLGRMTKRNEPDLISNWYYDKDKAGATCGKGVGKLCQAETSTGYNRIHSYDSLGRPKNTTTTIGSAYTASVTYDAATGRLATQTYPGGVKVKYVYTALGYLKEVRDGTSNALYWRASELDAEGHLVNQSYGNNIATRQTFDPTNGRITSIQAGPGNAVQNIAYTYDDLGNIESRSDSTQSLVEGFTYDRLNRLQSATVNAGAAGIVTTNYDYNGIGNIVTRSDVGTYTYNLSGAASVRPHALSRLDLAGGGYRSYTYNANGALTSEAQYDINNVLVAGKGRSIVYTSFSMPQSISSNGHTSSFAYGPEHQRAQQVSSAAAGTTIYLNPNNEGGLLYEKDIRLDGSVEQRNFITSGGGVVAMVKQLTIGGVTSTSTIYFHRDSLGSTTAITNSVGGVIERLAYEPFGKRRFPNGVVDPNNTIDPANTNRGFTNHEHLDELGLIHMNGRIYDPLTGRFTSADPFIQAPGNLQSYNRYSYVMNNPLLYTDPSGYLFGFVGDFVRDVWKEVWHSEIGQGLIQVGVVVVGGLPAAIIYSGARTAYYGGSVGDIFRSAAITWATATAFEVVGDKWAGGTFGNVMGHAAVGCASSVASGGKCGAGAMSAGFGAAAAPFVPKGVGGVVISAVVGGTASILGGGKFGNGAVTAAFGYMFNWCKHNDCFDVGGMKLETELRPQIYSDEIGVSCIQGGICIGVGPGAIEAVGMRLISAIPRALTSSDLGLVGTIDKLDGTIAMVGSELKLTVDMIEGNLQISPRAVMQNLDNLAVSVGATNIEIRATLANPELARALRMTGWKLEPGIAPYAETFKKTVTGW